MRSVAATVGTSAKPLSVAQETVLEARFTDAPDEALARPLHAEGNRANVSLAGVPIQCPSPDSPHKHSPACAEATVDCTVFHRVRKVATHTKALEIRDDATTTGPSMPRSVARPNPSTTATVADTFTPMRRAIHARKAEALHALVTNAADDQILDPLAGAYARAAGARQGYADVTPMCTAETARKSLALASTQALRKLDRAGTILGLPLRNGRHVYPAWQFVEGRVVAGIARVREALGETSGWAYAMQLDSIRNTDEIPARTLREMLLAGDVGAAVSAAAAAAGDGGA